MLAGTTDTGYRPRTPFIPFHRRLQRWAVIVAHRRAGKTVACINDLIRAALTATKPDARFAYIAPYFAQAKDIAWDYLCRYSAPIPGTSFNITELRIDYPNGARIRLYGAENAERMRGLYLDGVIIDEPADIDPRVWPEILRPALADRKGWASFGGTPKGRNEFWQIREIARQNPAEWFLLELRASESGILDADELSAARKQLTPDQYAQEFECDFSAALAGAYFGREMVVAEREGRITAVALDDAIPVHTAWDIGYRDDTAIWFYQVVRDEIHVIDYHASCGQTIEHYTKLVADKGYRYGQHWLPHDARAKTLASGGKSVIEQLAAGLDFKKLAIVPNLDVQDGIQAARRALGQTWFDEAKCYEGLEALRQYQREYDEEKKAFREKPRHDWTSHPADAFRMLAVAWQNEPEIVKKPEAPRYIGVGEQNTATLDDLWKLTPQASRRI